MGDKAVIMEAVSVVLTFFFPIPVSSRSIPRAFLSIHFIYLRREGSMYMYV